MRWLLMGWCVLASLGCAGSRGGAAPPSRDEAAQAALLAYSDFCNVCPRSQGCGCMTAKDFARERWTAQAGPYLHAMRDYYDCQLSSTMADASLEAGDSVASLDVMEQRAGAFRPIGGGWQSHCGPHACLASMQAMQASLARARAPAYSPAPGEMLECRAARTE